MVAESISDAAFSITPSHSDVDDFVLVHNYVDAWLIWNVVPLYCSESDPFGERNAGLSIHILTCCMAYSRPGRWPSAAPQSRNGCRYREVLWGRISFPERSATRRVRAFCRCVLAASSARILSNG